MKASFFGSMVVLLAVNSAIASSQIYYEDFESYDLEGYQYVDAENLLPEGNAPGEWTFYTDTFGTSQQQGRIEITSRGGSQGQVLILHDKDNGYYSLNEAILNVDVQHYDNLELSFKTFDSNDEDDNFYPTTQYNYTSKLKKDGVSVASYDDTTGTWSDWFVAWDPDIQNNSWEHITIDLSDLIDSSNGELTASSQFQIKFQQYDNYDHGTDGRKWDDILLSGHKGGGGTGGNNPVPEPSSLATFLIGMVGLTYGIRRRRSNRQKQDQAVKANH